MNDDDRPGYLMDFLHAFASKHGYEGKFSPEDFYQQDSVVELQADFMAEVLDLAGFVKGGEYEQDSSVS